MKKSVKIVLVIVLVSMLFILSGCAEKAELENQVLTNEVAQNTENTVEANSTKEDDLRERYLKIVKGEEKFIGIDFENLEGEEGYLKDFEMCGKSELIAKYGFVDMDGDGIEEMVGDTTSDGGFYIVFHYENEKIYGYLFSARAIHDVKMDGSHYGTGGATYYGYSKMKFSGTEYENIDLAHRLDNEYTIDGKPSTKAEFDKFEEAQNAKESMPMEIYVSDEIGASVLDFSNSDEVIYTTKEEGDAQSEFGYTVLTLKKDGTVSVYETYTGATGHGAMQTGTYVYKNGKINATYTKASNPETPDDFYDDFSPAEYEIKDGKLYNQETPYYTAEYVRQK